MRVTASIIWVSMRSTGLSVIIGSWKIMAISRAADGAQLVLGRPTSSSPAKPDRAFDDAARRIDQAEDRQAGDGLARARFADQPQHLAAADLEDDAVDRLGDAFAR